MFSGRINTKGKLERGRANPTREILPPEPDYLKDAERFREKRQKAREKKKEMDKLVEVKEKNINKIRVIKNLNFILPYSRYKNKPLSQVIKLDPDFVRSLIKSGHYEIADTVITELVRQGIIKRA